MYRIIKYTLALLLSTMIFSCRQDAASPQMDGDVNDVKYGAFGTKGTPPQDKATFTFVSYQKMGDGSYAMEPDYGLPTETFNRLRPEGKYVYFENDPLYKGVLQPCTVDSDFQYIARDGKKGQGLRNGEYLTACIFPAITLEKFQNQFMMSYQRDQERRASVPFPMHVKGYEVFELEDELPIYDMRSRIVLDIEQQTPTDFTIEDVKLVSAGYWGWYHPRKQTVLVGYNSADREDVYDKIDNESGTSTSVENLVISNDYVNVKADVYETGNRGMGEVPYTTGLGDDDGFFFFPNDYSSDNYAQPGLEFKLVMNGEDFLISVPFTINMKKNTRYKFRVIVESEVVKVRFKVIPWNSVDNSGEVGEGAEQILGIWKVENWVEIFNDIEDIG